MDQEQVRKRLLAEQDVTYQAFQYRLIPNAGKLIGVRMPKLRKMAAEIVREDWRTWMDARESDRWYEEIILRGLVTALAEMPLAERLERIRTFIPQIQNWAVCDCICSTLHLDDKIVLWDFLQPYLHSEEEFPARFGAVMLLENFITLEDLPRTLSALVQIPAKGYNARIGIAWALSICGVKFPQQTLGFLETAKLDDWTYNKALQKMLESRRLPDALRQDVRACKRKTRGLRPH